MSRIWEEYILKRYKAQKNIAKILRRRGIEDLGFFDPQNMSEFRLNWKERIDPGDRTGVLERDRNAQPIILPDGHQIVYIYVSSDPRKDKIPKATIRSYLLHFIQISTGMTGEQAFNQVELIKNRELIIVSDIPLDGSAKNEISAFNSILEYSIRHFTIPELQFDPTEHMSGPEEVRVLSTEEVDNLIASQRGLVIGAKKRLVPDYQRRLDEIRDEATRAEFIRTTNEEILSKLPTMNSNDPWVKWRGYKNGDILKITRRSGNSRVTYRRVILIEPAEIKPPKVKITKTTM